MQVKVVRRLERESVGESAGGFAFYSYGYWNWNSGRQAKEDIPGF